MRFRSFVLGVLRRLPPVCLLAAVGLAAYLFAEGYYTFSFLQEEGSLTPPTVFSPTGEDTPGTPSDTPTTVAPGEDTQTVTLPPPTSLSAAMTAAEVHTLAESQPFQPLSSQTLQAAGFSLSTETYTADSHVLARVEGLDFLPDRRFYDEGTRVQVNYVRPDPMGEPVARYTEYTEEVPAVEPYMGYLLLQRDGKTAVYTSDGVYMMTYDAAGYKCANTRDRAGNPLFSATVTEADGTVVTMYYTVGQGGFVPSDYSDETDGRGLYYDYAPSFGLSDTNLRRLAWQTTTVTEKLDGSEETVDSTLWAYGYSTAYRTTGYNYTLARDYSEGLAAVTKENGRLYYIGPYGYQAFYTERSYYYFEWFVLEYLLPPLTDGEESMGFYYYDHGLVRARRQIVDWSWITYHDLKKVALDDDFLMDKSGKEFPIPEGYDIVSYSDGVILLTKDGKYGYMDYTGKWILQPICPVARPFFEGVAVATLADKSRVLIDTAGNILIPPGEYVYISDMSSGVVAACRRDGTWEVFHKMAKFG